MEYLAFPTIDPVATGKNIIRLRKQRGLTVKDLQDWFGFLEPRAIYKWQTGQSLPSIDNLYALSILLDVPMDSIIVGTYNTSIVPQAACGSHCFIQQAMCFLLAFHRLTIKYFPSRLNETSLLSINSSAHNSHIPLFHSFMRSFVLPAM